MKSTQQHTLSPRLYGMLSLGVIVLAGLVVGWNTLDAGYLSGDDEHLIYNHALVNHPSVPHALKLFKIIHRDLYQPIPLLSFQLEFALHGGDPAMLHLTNVLLHTLNGLLVCLLFGRLSGNRAAALLIALLFVVHPLAVEAYAWLNGRMIMLSTTFVLASLIAMDAWRKRPGGIPFAALTIAFAILAMMSKVRVGLPVLFLLLPLAQRFRPPRRWWLLWSAVCVITAGFALLNWSATVRSGLFEGGEEFLEGPWLARVVLAMSWYLRHYLWPSGLASWYGPPKVVSWSDAEVLLGIAVLVVAAVVLVVTMRRFRVGPLGLAWFLATIAVTLPLPLASTRNILAADRYMYLPIIGLHWIAAAVFFQFVNRLRSIDARRLWQVLASGAVAAILICCVGVSRMLTGFYANDEVKFERIIEQSPDHPTLLSSLGWIHYTRGDYERAIELAEAELDRFGDYQVAFCRALSLKAMSRYALDHDFEAAEKDLLETIRRDREFFKGYYRLALIYKLEGRGAEAIEPLEQVLRIEPEFNHARKLLARIYRESGQLERASQEYQEAVRYSRGYDVEAIIALGEIEIQQGRFELAVERYRRLLSWHEQGIAPRINLGIALSAIGRDKEAWEQFQAVLVAHPRDHSALRSAADFLRRRGRYGAAAKLWGLASSAQPGSADALAWHGLHQWYLGNVAEARAVSARALGLDSGQQLARMTELLIAVSRSDSDLVARRSESFLGLEAAELGQVLEYAFEALEFHSAVEPESPWPYYVTTVLLVSQGRPEVARQSLSLFDAKCDELVRRERLRAIVESGLRDVENAEETNAEPETPAE